MSAPRTPSSSWNPPRFAAMTIGRKLVAIVVLCVGIGFAAIIGVHISGTRADLHDLAYRDSLQMTRLLATSIAGGVRWQQPEAVERAYLSFLDGANTGLESFVAMDIDGQILADRNFSDHRPEDHDSVGHAPASPEAADGQHHELGPVIEDAREWTSRDEDYVTSDHDHIIVVAPVLIGHDRTRVGTLAVAWRLDEVNALVTANFQRQGITAGFSLLALIVLLLSMLHRTVSRPLRAVSRATMLIAQGEDFVPVPETERGDEIGEMARSLEVFKYHIEMLDEMSAGKEEHRRQLSEALENERKYNALHREFVSMASHEFRTPLAIIDGAAQRLIRRAERMTPDELLERVGKIRHAVTRMIGLIDSTLSASRMEAGRIELAVEPCDLREILGTVCRRQQEIAPEHEIALDLRQAPKLIEADPKQLDQVFTNLLSNAVKYSPNKGRIEVMAGREGDMAVISVRDHGVGIPPAELPNLFERFFRASTSTGIPGTGIGLNLAKQLVEMHGGSIGVTSIPGQGSTFAVHLPMTAMAECVNPTQAGNGALLSETGTPAAAQG